MTRVHAYGDDALGEHDAVALADLIRRKERSPEELAQAALARAHRVETALRAIEVHAPPSGLEEVQPHDAEAPFAGVPTFIKDNVDVAGLPTRYGSRSLGKRPAERHDPVTRQFLAQGFQLLGKSRLPEFGFSPSTEFEHDEPTRNPWNPEYSSGASSGGAAALVAAGVVPIAHANDGGGSIRIPAACCGLVGLKPTRGRVVMSSSARRLPIKIVSDGVVSRTVRDTAHFLASAEQLHPTRRLPPVGLVEGPSERRLHIGVVLDSIGGLRSCDETRGAVQRAAEVLEKLGHRIEPIAAPVPDFFMEDFKLYWGLLAYSVHHHGPRYYEDLNAEHLDSLTVGLSEYFQRSKLRAPIALARLQASSLAYRFAFRRFDAVLSPVVSYAVPKLGFLSPRLPFEVLFERITHFSAFTPLNNATGSPAIAVPAALSKEGLPIGVHLSSRHGGEATLLDLAYQLEAEARFPRITDAAAA